MVLWCYLIWYLVVLSCYFDPDPALWLTSAGLSLIIGIALNLNARAGARASVSGGRDAVLDGATGSSAGTISRWQTIRFFLIPFCVSSFSSLVKGRGFVLVFSPQPAELAVSVAACALFCLAVALARRQPLN